MRRMLAVALVAAAVLAGCGGGEAGSPAPSPTQTDAAGGGAAAGGGSAAVGPGLSIAEALTTSAEGPLLVRGFLVADGDDVALCEALAKSLPPQCSGRTLAVAGLDLEGQDGLEQSGDVRWSPAEITLLGEIEGDVLTVDSRSSA